MSSFGISRTTTDRASTIDATIINGAAYQNNGRATCGMPSDDASGVCGNCGNASFSTQRRLVCFTPRSADGIVSCLTVRDRDRAALTTDDRLAVVPANAIIDCVEFYGYGAFSTKESFSIALGQLNQGMSSPLIEDAVSETANEKNGGRRHMVSTRPDGRNDISLVLYNSNVNVMFNQPVANGGLMVCVTYHVKPSAIGAPTATTAQVTKRAR